MHAHIQATHTIYSNIISYSLAIVTEYSCNKLYILKYISKSMLNFIVHSLNVYVKTQAKALDKIESSAIVYSAVLKSQIRSMPDLVRIKPNLSAFQLPICTEFSKIVELRSYFNRIFSLKKFQDSSSRFTGTDQFEK